MNRKISAKDNYYMGQALRLALKADGRTSPNPIVGAVITRGGKIIGRGYHKACGLPHAEVNAIRDAALKARGATLYVTLEPCDHFGRTGPCTEAIISAGIKKVVMGVKDPNPMNNGRGTATLKAAGLKIVTGVLEDECRAINKPYNKFIKSGLPYVTLKLAESVDGKIATRTGDSRWITGEDARRYVHILRGKSDAVMVGAGTVLSDNPVLTNRSASPRQPVRVIVDSRLSTPLDAKIFNSAPESPVIVATAKNFAKASLYESKGAQVVAAPSRNGMVDLRKLLKALAGMNITNVLVEGGGNLAAGLIEKGLVDKFLFFIAPKILGGRDAVTSVEGRGVARVKDAVTLRKMKIKKFKRDILIEAEAG